MQGPIEVGRCANREANKCCAGSSWDCQAPGSTCSCDQVNKSLEKLPYTQTNDSYHMSHTQCPISNAIIFENSGSLYLLQNSS